MHRPVCDGASTSIYKCGDASIQKLGVLSSADAPEGKAQLCIYAGAAALGWADGPNLRMEISWGSGNVNRALHQRCFGTAIIYGTSK